VAVAPRTLFLDEANRNLHGTGGTTRRVPEAQGAPWAFVWCGLVLMLEPWCSISGAVPAPRRPSRRPGAAHLHRLNRRHGGSAASRSHEIETIACRRGRVRFSRRAIFRQSMTGPRTVGSRAAAGDEDPGEEGKPIHDASPLARLCLREIMAADASSHREDWAPSPVFRERLPVSPGRGHPGPAGLGTRLEVEGLGG
jgi:hypothetical protein